MTTTEAVYEMFWDCKYCGQKKLLGLTHRFCASCGAPQDPAARYFPADHEKVPVHAHPYVGADVTCPSCRQPMSRAAKCCTNCGGPLVAGVEVRRRADVAPPASQKKTSWVPLVLGIAGALVALLVGVFVVARVWTREGVLEVREQAWQRTVAIERFQPTRRSAWCDERPAGAREISRHRDERGSRQVKDGETCTTRKKDRGDGTYAEVRECKPRMRSEPVMDDRCEFEVNTWQTARTLVEKGASPKDPPRWPTVALSNPGSCLGCEREGARTESYTVRFVDTKTGKEASCDLPEKTWATFAKGSRWKGKVRVMTGGVECAGLTGA